MADNDESIVLVGYAKAGPIDVFDKRSRTWLHVNLPATARRVRAFGSWLAAIAEEPAYVPPGSAAVNIAGKDSNIVVRESPGASIRLNEPVGKHGSVEDFFHAARAYFPGRLFLYNVVSKASFEIRTDQGDSEVLLVTDYAVFYRVNDDLFRAPLTSVGVGKPSNLASGEEVLSAHWAFSHRSGMNAFRSDRGAGLEAALQRP